MLNASKAGHTWIEIGLVQQGPAAFQSMYGLVGCTQVDLPIKVFPEQSARPAIVCNRDHCILSAEGAEYKHTAGDFPHPHRKCTAGLTLIKLLCERSSLCSGSPVYWELHLAHGPLTPVFPLLCQIQLRHAALCQYAPADLLLDVDLVISFLLIVVVSVIL